MNIMEYIEYKELRIPTSILKEWMATYEYHRRNDLDNSTSSRWLLLCQNMMPIVFFIKIIFIKWDLVPLRLPLTKLWELKRIRNFYISWECLSLGMRESSLTIAKLWALTDRSGMKCDCQVTQHASSNRFVVGTLKCFLPECKLNITDHVCCQ